MVTQYAAVAQPDKAWGNTGDPPEPNRWHMTALVLLEFKLPVADIDPLPKFIADLVKACHLVEAECFMQADAAGVGQGDAAKGQVAAVCGQACQQFIIKLSPEAAPGLVGGEVDRGFHRKAIDVARAPGLA